MSWGFILWFNEEKGFGAIEVTGSNEALFFHHKQILYPHNRFTVKHKDKVEFDVYESPRVPGKLEARNIRKI